MAQQRRRPDLAYKALGVGEYWAVDLDRERVVAHRLDAAGVYQTSARTGGALDARTASALAVPLTELFADGPR